ncbi:hypothetical protein FRC17_002869 [Serendipita sp. 399]|nr:hypothetical protein FRC17_002869 [Serendipita sp. 399]
MRLTTHLLHISTLTLALFVNTLHALPQPQSPSSTSAAVTSGTSSSSSSLTPTSTSTTSGNPDASVSTATPSVTGASDAPLPSQAALPPTQAWCPSQIFCAGKILQAINIAQPYADSKTIVDKPTNGSSQSVIQAFDQLEASGNNTLTYGEIVSFLQSSFQGEGLELDPTQLSNFPQNPKAFQDIKDDYVRGFTLEVHKIWNLLIRDTDESRVCSGSRNCESSLIPLNHTFVVPGGRFREQYYWDSKFILEGLLKSELYSVANSTLQNFMDEIERFGFIPNGGRIYYLNRSQPPVFIGMVLSYYNATQDDATLNRALPLMERELEWWSNNRSLTVVSPYTNQTRKVYHYSVTNSAPRPESYLEDYEAANGADLTTAYNDTQKAALYAELASGAETGWDYSTRWTKEPLIGNIDNQNPILRSLNVRNTTAVDLNALVYKGHVDLAEMYDLRDKSLARRGEDGGGSHKKRQGGGGSGGSGSGASFHRTQAANLKAAILDLFWDEDRLAFYDFNLTSRQRNEQLTAAHWTPLWAGIVPEQVQRNETAAFGVFSSLHLVLRKFNGTIPATFIESGLQWVARAVDWIGCAGTDGGSADFPNAWPPHIFFALEALANVPANISQSPVPNAPNENSWNLVPANQLGLTEDRLPLQLLNGNNTAPRGQDLNALNGTVVNGGDAPTTTPDREGWVKALQREIANRYVTSVYCSWYATGGSIPNLLPRLPNETLALTQSTDQTGHLFEKFSALDVDSAGRGGEYAVQAGFGWTNGVLLWVASEFGDVLVRPTCPQITPESTGTGQNAGVERRGKMGLASVLVAGLLAAGLML